jgi:hypothetical protein
MANKLVINETPEYSLSVVDGTELTLSLLGPSGPTGPTGPAGAAGPNTVTTSTTTNLTGYIFGNGTNIAGATTASSSEGSGTLVIRDTDGSFGTTSSNSDASIIGVNTGNGNGLVGTSQSGAGGLSITIDGNYHHKFGFFSSGSGAPAIAAIERLRGWFVWFRTVGETFFTGRLKTADITANREWTLPNASGTLTLDSHTHVISDVTGLQTALDDKSPAPASSFNLTYTGTLPVPMIPILTTTPLRDAMLGASGSQAATLRSGKWVTGISITGSNNPTIDSLTTLSSSDIVGIRDSFALASLTKLTTVSFQALASIGGGFNFISGGNMNALTTISFPALASIGSSFNISSGLGTNLNSLTAISFPALASVGGGFNLNGGATNNNIRSLTTVSFPALASVGSSFSFSGGGNMNALTTVSFPALASVGSSFNFGGSTNMHSLTAVSFPTLTSIGAGFLFNSAGSTASLTTVSFPALASVGDTMAFNSAGFIYSLTTVSFPALASVGSNFTINGVGFMTSFTTLLIGSGLKHINGNFLSGNVSLDGHNAWSAGAYYPSYTSFTAPASAFSSTGTTCTVTLTDHGLETGSLITVSGLTGTTEGIHPFNTNTTAPVAITRISSSQFSYTIAATTLIATGTATIQRQGATVTPITKNGRKYICTTAGTSGATEPTWPTTIGNTVADGTAVWTCSEMSQANILSRLDALDGTNQTITYGANRFINIAPTTLITISSIATASGTATITTVTNHGITTGTQVVISGCTGTALRYNGVWTVTSTGLTTLTATVPTDLNGVAGAGAMRLTTAAPQYTGILPIASTSIVGAASDSHSIFSETQLRDSDSGTPLPVFPAGIYTRNGTTNGFAKYSCVENGWDIWYDTTRQRWANTPSASTGNTTVVSDYPNTPRAVAISSTSTANPAVITSSVAHGIATNAVFTVVIEGCSNAALNGSWTAISTGTTTFTIPVSGAAGATTNSGTVAVLNQTLNQGRLMSTTAAAPIQGVQQTITRNSHGFSNGDFIHFYGAVGTQATSCTDLNTSATVKSTTSAITVVDGNSFSCVRYASTQPFIGSYTLTTQPHMRETTVNDVAYYSALKLRARGVATTLHGTTGL